VNGKQAAQAAAVSYRQFDYWCRSGYLGEHLRAAPGNGNPRRVGPDELLRARLLGQLTAAGVDVARAAQLLDTHPLPVDSDLLHLQVTPTVRLTVVVPGTQQQPEVAA
jgi:hypothetical protein